MEHALHADMRVSGAIGGNQAERDRIFDVALGALDLKLQPIAEGRPADVLLLDQNIGADLLGTDVAAAARKRGFHGVTVVLTARRAATSLASARCRTSTSVQRRERRCPSYPPGSAAPSPPRAREL